MGLNRFAKGFFDPLIELYRPVPPLAWAPLIISVLGIDNSGKIFLLFMVSFIYYDYLSKSWSIWNAIVKNPCSSLSRGIKKTNIKICNISKFITRNINWWLPKPSDTFNKFILMSNPSVGYKDVPLLWIQLIDVSQIIGFILPDWLADIIPGEYPIHTKEGIVEQNFKGNVLKIVTGDFSLFKVPVPYGHIWDSFLRVLLGLIFGIIIGVPLGLFMGLNRFAKGFFDPLIELYRPVPPLAWAPLIISVLGIDNSGKIFLLFMVSLSIMIISARAGASGTQLSKIHAAHSLGASKKQILRYVIFPNSLPEILTGIRVAVGMCWGTLVAAEFLAGTTGIGFVENVAKKYFQYEVIWITIFIMGMLGLLFDVTLRKLIDKYIPWRGKG